MIYLGNTDLFDNSELETLLKQVEQLKLLKEKYGIDYKPTKKKCFRCPLQEMGFCLELANISVLKEKPFCLDGDNLFCILYLCCILNVEIGWD